MAGMETTTYEVTRSVNGAGFRPFDGSTPSTLLAAQSCVLTDYHRQNPASDPEYRINGEPVYVCPGGQEDRTARRNADGDRVKACVMCDTEWSYDQDEIEPHLAPEGRRPRIRVTHDPESCEMCAKAIRQARTTARMTGSVGASCTYSLFGGGEADEHHATWSTGKRPG